MPDAMITPQKLKEEMGLDGRVVRGALKSAGLKLDDQGRVPYERAKAIVLAKVDIGKSISHGMAGSGHHEGADAGSIRDLAQHKSELASLQARKLRVEIEKREGNLLDKATVLEAFADLVTRARDHILLTPATIAARAAGKSEAEIKAIVDEELRRALTTLGDENAFMAEVLA